MTLPEGIEHTRLLPLLLVAFLPLLLHLLDRRRARVVDWPAMRLLIGKDRSRLRRMQLREALLMGARSLAALLIALALLQPTGHAVRPGSAGLSSPRAVVLAIDTTGSMAYRDQPGRPSSLERARTAALRVVDEAPPGSRVAIIEGAGAAGGDAEWLEVEPARARISALEPVARSFRLVDALDDAARALSGFPLPGEVHVFTDLQATVLAGAGPERAALAAERLRASRPEPLIRLVDCGFESPSNRFVSSIEPGPLAVAAGELVTLRAIVERSGTPMGPAEMELVAPGGDVARAPLPEETGTGLAPVEMEHRFEAGTFAVAVRLPPDGLIEDDARRLVLEVPDRIEVLITGTAIDDGGAGTARYADLALAPRSAGIEAPPVPFRARFAEGIDEDSLRGKRVAIITGLLRLGDVEASILERFVRDGGGLLVFAGAGIDLAALEAKLHRGGAGILPARLAGREAAPGEGIHPRDVLVDHPALAVFADPEEGELSRITVRRWTKAVDPEKGSSVLARLGEGDPWIIEKSTGRGKMVLVTTSAAPDDSDLPLTPLFVPLMHRLARYLALPVRGDREVLCGDPISIPADAAGAGASARALLPDGSRRPVPIELVDGRLQAVFRETRAPGAYEIRIEREGAADGEAPIASGTFAVNFPVEESRLERAGPESIQRLGSTIGVSAVRDTDPVERALVMEEVKVPAWPAAVALALSLLFAELVLARRIAGGR